MIAEFVTTVASAALSPSVAAASASSSSSASRVSRISRRGARSAISLASPSLAARRRTRPGPRRRARGRVERLQPPLGAELEERVGLQARLLGLAVLAGADGGLHAVERERDQVVVGLVGRLLPRRRHRRVELVLARSVELPRPRRAGDAVRLARGLVDDGARAGEARRRPRRAAASRLASWSREVVERRSAPPSRRRPPPGSRSPCDPAVVTPRPYSTARARGSAAAAGRGAPPRRRSAARR